MANRRCFLCGEKQEIGRALHSNASSELSYKLSQRLSNLQDGDVSETKRMTLNKTNSVTPAPPPPPPENLLGDSRVQSQNNGCVRVSLSKALAKSTSDLTESACDHYETLPTRRTSRVTVNGALNRADFPSGILKVPVPESSKTLGGQKSITFGEMPTLTRDKPSTKT